MRGFWRWTISFIFLLMVILLVEISYSLFFGKPPAEPLKSAMPVVAVILAFLIAAVFNFYQSYKSSKGKSPKKR